MPKLARVQPEYQLQPLELVAPGFRGVNTVQSGALLDPSYCTQANNAIIDVAGRLAARNGLTQVTTTRISQSFTLSAAPASGATSGALTTTPGAAGSFPTLFSNGQTVTMTVTYGNNTVTWTPALTSSATTALTSYLPINSSFEYVKGGPTYTQLVAWPNGISNNLANPGANNIGGTPGSSNSTGQWYFQNFNNKVIAFVSGAVPAVWAGTGNFQYITASQGTVPTSSGVGCCAFGRVWTVSTDGQTIRYSGLLDETDWGSASSGTIDMHTIWSAGTDTVTAIAAFNASLVVFGTNHIIFFTDGRGSMLGLDPTQAYVFDTIGSTGCYSQWTVQQIGEGDMVFLGPNGVQSIANLQNARSFPMSNLTKYVRDQLLANLAAETIATVRSTYNNQLGQYFLSFPNSGIVYCLDVRRLYTDQIGDQCGIVTTWGAAITACHSTQSNVTYMARTPGYICTYGGSTDEGTQFLFSYTSGWLDLGQQVSEKLKMLKRFELILFSVAAQQVNLTWATDFGNTTTSAAITLPGSSTVSQYGSAQYGVSQYGGSSGLAILKYDSRARGQYYQVGVTAPVLGALSMQQIQLAVKIGRTA